MDNEAEQERQAGKKLVYGEIIQVGHFFRDM